MPESELYLICSSDRMRTITRSSLGSKPSVRQVVDGENYSLIVRTTQPGIVHAVAKRTGAVVASHAAPTQAEEDIKTAQSFGGSAAGGGSEAHLTDRDEFNPPQGNISEQDDVPVVEDPRPEHTDEEFGEEKPMIDVIRKDDGAVVQIAPEDFDSDLYDRCDPPLDDRPIISEAELADMESPLPAEPDWEEPEVPEGQS